MNTTIFKVPFMIYTVFRIPATRFSKHFKDNKDLHSLELFNNRSEKYVDIVILLDWDTTTLKLSSHIKILKDILMKWDPGVKYKKIKYLNGGLSEWVTTYPAITFNPNAIMPEFNNDTDSTINSILGTIEYPEIQDEEILKLNKRDVVNKDVEMDHGDNKTAFKHARSNSNNVISSARSKNFTSHVRILTERPSSRRYNNCATIR